MTNMLSAEQSGNRSRGYPALALDEAVAKAKKLYLEEDKHVVTCDVASGHWGYTATSSSGRTCLATLKKFGLLEEVGGGTSGKVRVSRLALDIILFDNDEHRKDWLKALKTAAVMPSIYSGLWEQWGPRLPSDGSMRSHLIREMGFNEATATTFIKAFKRTISFAQLDHHDKDTSSGEEVSGGIESEPVIAHHNPNSVTGTVPGIRNGSDTITSTAPYFHQSSHAEMREEVYVLDEGPVHLRYPAKLNAHSFEDFKDWLELVLRKAKRWVQVEADEVNV